jgi:hypothetical protein
VFIRIEVRLRCGGSGENQPVDRMPVLLGLCEA